jgi:hypothetical protein
MVNISMEVPKARAMRPPHIASPQVYDGDPPTGMDASMSSQRSSGEELAFGGTWYWKNPALHALHLLDRFAPADSADNVSLSRLCPGVCHNGDSSDNSREAEESAPQLPQTSTLTGEGLGLRALGSGQKVMSLARASRSSTRSVRGSMRIQPCLWKSRRQALTR